MFFETVQNYLGQTKEFRLEKLMTLTIYENLEKLTSGIHAHAIAFNTAIRFVNFCANPLFHFGDRSGDFLWIKKDFLDLSHHICVVCK